MPVCLCVQNGHQVGLGHILLLQDATYDTAGEYVCEVTVPSLPGLHTTGSVHIIVQGESPPPPPSQLLGESAPTVQQGVTQRDSLIHPTHRQQQEKVCGQKSQFDIVVSVTPNLTVRVCVCPPRCSSGEGCRQGGGDGRGRGEAGQPELRGPRIPSALHHLAHPRQPGKPGGPSHVPQPPRD